jgi:dTDP-4-amino-4,6-dideoxygalactose transaminase
MPLSIPQSNPRAGYLAHKKAIDEAISRVLESGWYILGREVASFETEFAAYLGTSHAVGVASGTDALHLSLRACGVGPGDHVITVSHTATATAAAIDLCGATPLFVDIDPDRFTMDPNSLEDVLRGSWRRKPKAVVPVHLYGHPVDMPAIMGIADRHNLRVVEDCAQSHGAALRREKTGTWGHMGAFSFYPTKNLGALGDGGMVVTGDPELADKVRLLREYGWKERYVSKIPGMNSRLDEIQAAILRAKLLHLDEENDSRRRIAGAYDSLLADRGLILPDVNPEATHAYHQYVIRTENRESLRTHLRGRGIATLIHYPVPVHQQPAYANRSADDMPLPRTEEAARKILSLPMYPELSADQVRTVAREIVSWCRT